MPSRTILEILKYKTNPLRYLAGWWNFRNWERYCVWHATQWMLYDISGFAKHVVHSVSAGGTVIVSCDSLGSQKWSVTCKGSQSQQDGEALNSSSHSI
jgi:hypothetical protein